MFTRRTLTAFGILGTAIWSCNAEAQGIIAAGSGATHRSMAGASTATAIDAAGALYWNAAAIGGFGGSEVVVASEMIIPDTHLSSTIPAGAFGILGPATTLSGTTRSDSGLVPTTGLGIVYKPVDSRLTLGLGIATLAAGGVNFPGDPNNPILAPTGPLDQFILGPQAGSLVVLGIIPTAAFQVTERLVVGFSPMLDVSVVSFDPAFFGPTSQARVTDPRQFPSGAHSRPFWGGGFRGGATYRVAEHLTAGLSYTSPQWFETWRFNARDASGNPIKFRTQFSLPPIYSVGLSYDGIEKLLLSADVRYFEYTSTKLLGQAPVDGGAGWDNVWAFALGSRYQVTDRLSAQLGYLYNENPVPNNLTLFNTQLPAIIKHTFSIGAMFQVNQSIGMSLAYVHGFKNTVAGAISPLLGTNTAIDSEYDSLAFGVHIKFGRPASSEVYSTAEIELAPPGIEEMP